MGKTFAAAARVLAENLNLPMLFAEGTFLLPGEETLVDGAFARHASPDALLVTFHDFDRVLVQRKLDDQQDLQALGCM